MSDYKMQAAEFLLRAFAGILFLFQGYDKLFKIKMPGVINAFAADAETQRIPPVLLKLVAYFTSSAELLGGLLLLIGFCTTFALYFLGIDLLIVCLAFSYMNPMWDLKFVFPRLVLVAGLLIIPGYCRVLSLDHLLNP